MQLYTMRSMFTRTRSQQWRLCYTCFSGQQAAVPRLWWQQPSWPWPSPAGDGPHTSRVGRLQAHHQHQVDVSAALHARRQVDSGQAHQQQVPQYQEHDVTQQEQCHENTWLSADERNDSLVRPGVLLAPCRSHVLIFSFKVHTCLILLYSCEDSLKWGFTRAMSHVHGTPTFVSLLQTAKM